MRSLQDIAVFLQAQPRIMALLRGVAGLEIADCWIGAGLIRNAVWGQLHGFHVELIAGSDVDVVYCDLRDTSLDRDLAIEARLFEFPSPMVCAQSSSHERAQRERNLSQH